MIDHIKLLESYEIPSRRGYLRGLANRILRHDHTDPTTPSHIISINWAQRFLKRHPELHITKAKPLAADRKRTHNPAVIRDWFFRLKDTIQEFGILSDDIYNMDETGYQTGCGRSQMIVTTKPRSRIWLKDPENRQHITSIECISATGYHLPSLIILTSSQILHNMIVPELDPDTVLAVSDSGFSNDDISMERIRHFNRHTKTRTKGAKRLLLLDSVNSHLEWDFIEYCWDENIIPFAFIPHTTHLCQALDVKCFQLLKHYHSEAIDSAIRVGDSEFSRLEFLAAFQTFHQQAFATSTILSAFRATGVVP